MKPFNIKNIIIISAIIALGLLSQSHAATQPSPNKENTSDCKGTTLRDGTTIIPHQNSACVITESSGSSGTTIQITRGNVQIISNKSNNVIVTTPTARLVIINANVNISVNAKNGETRASINSGASISMESGGKQLTLTGSDTDSELVSESNKRPPVKLLKSIKRDKEANNTDDKNPSTGSTLPTVTPPPTSSPNQDSPDSFDDSASGVLGVIFAANTNDAKSNSEVNVTNNDTLGTHQLLTGNNSEITKQAKRSRGTTTNRIYSSEKSFTQHLNKNLLNTNPTSLGDSDSSNKANYKFITDDPEKKETKFLIIDLDDEITKGNLPVFSNDAAISFYWDEAKKMEDDSIISEFHKNDAPKGFSDKSTNPSRETDNEVGSIFINNGEDAFYQMLTTGFIDTEIKNTSDNPTNVINRKDENFLMLQVDSKDPKKPNSRYVFAAGDVREGKQNLSSASVDQMFISAGLDKYGEKKDNKKSSDIRAFARNETVIGNDPTALNDSGLLIVNPAAKDKSAQPTRVLHTDFIIKGAGKDQTSTISTTLGKVDYLKTRFSDKDPKDDSPSDGANDVELKATTQGSTQGINEKNEKVTVSFKSDMKNTSAGGGLATAGSGEGYADYFVLENFDPDEPAPRGGTEHAIGTAKDQDKDYAYLRLASIKSSTAEKDLKRTTSPTNTGGYVAGLVKTEKGGDKVTIERLKSTGNTPQENLNIKKDLASNGVTATIKHNKGSQTLGGRTDNGTYVDDERFAASDGSATIVSGGMVEAGIDPSIKVNVPKYMQWGFYFGDANTGEGVSHAHLASWVSGTVPSASDLPKTGTASYNGSAIGNVYNKGDSYVASGTYQNDWDFSAKKGDTKLLDFDGVNYSGNTALQGDSSQFAGSLKDTGGTRNVGIDGSFVQNGTDAAAGMMGQFTIQGADYLSAGTFAADAIDRP